MQRTFDYGFSLQSMNIDCNGFYLTGAAKAGDQAALAPPKLRNEWISSFLKLST